jgi:hypothetical protein
MGVRSAGGRKRRKRRLGGPLGIVVRALPVGLLVGVGLASFSEEARATPPTRSASQLVSQALANAKKGGWVHEVAKASEKGHTFSATNDIGATGGRQNIQSDAARAKVILIKGVAYIEANAAGVANYFDFTTADPAQLAGRWFTLTPSSTGYATVTDAVTLASDFDQLGIAGPYTAGKQTVVDHQKVIPVHGFVSGASKGLNAPITLYVTATGTTLPVKFSASSKSVTDTVVWSRWGKPVHLVPPGNPKPLPSGLSTV